MPRRVVTETTDVEVHGDAHRYDPELDRVGHFVGHVHVHDNGPGDVWDVDEETGRITGRHAEPEAPADGDPAVHDVIDAPELEAE